MFEAPSQVSEFSWLWLEMLKYFCKSSWFSKNVNIRDLSLVVSFLRKKILITYIQWTEKRDNFSTGWLPTGYKLQNKIILCNKNIKIWERGFALKKKKKKNKYHATDWEGGRSVTLPGKQEINRVY